MKILTAYFEKYQQMAYAASAMGSDLAAVSSGYLFQYVCVSGCVESDVQCVVCGVWYVVCGVWYVVCGMWCVVCGMWCVVCDMFCMVCGVWVHGACLACQIKFGQSCYSLLKVNLDF